MKLYLYRSDQFIGNALLFNIYINDKIMGRLPPGEEVSFDLPPGSYKLSAKTDLSPDFFINTYFLKLIKLLVRYFPKTSMVICIDSPRNIDDKIFYTLGLDSPSTFEELKQICQRMINLIGLGKRPHNIFIALTNKADFKKRKVDEPLKAVIIRKRSPETTDEKQLVLWNIALGALMLVFGVYVLNQPLGDTSKMGFIMFLAGLGPTVRLLRYLFSKRLTFRYKFLRGFGIIIPVYFIIFATQVYNNPRLFGISILFIVAYLYIFFRAKSVLKR